MSKVNSEAIGNAMQLAFESGGLQEGETRVALVGPLQKRRLTKALVTDASYPGRAGTSEASTCR